MKIRILILSLLLAVGAMQVSNAQTVLAPGDIAIIGVASNSSPAALDVTLPPESRANTARCVRYWTKRKEKASAQVTELLFRPLRGVPHAPKAVDHCDASSRVPSAAWRHRLCRGL